ncbi:DUF4302 domain-containing protein [Solitalea canadensis]|uniref:DUF4302 domain-containing protein n=1 Tax=Solitalea canadensis (strain ATCC 29591 / DSM 3403 / JCM 21819 / LMG 8368 / NBRC 15130 / NCIMB 12057 / USAM 9D) TaxID=929556 RepID=H8KUV8_SOLCM|nr:DUF4302 domain-containing protein [Solitalea canadensis]AFD07658.1 hypothetical protein Solca_2624 [Solitalea canadensis DSM 3403]
MKNIYKYLLFIGMGVIVASCAKEAENLILAGTPRMEEVCAQYKKTLADAELGWVIEYKPAANSGSFNMHLVFSGDSVHIKSDYNVSATNNYLDQANVKYDVKGVIFPELTFSTYSVFEKLYENAGGHFEFEIKPDSSGSFWLNPVHLVDKNIRFHLKKATAQDVLEFNAKVDRQKVINGFITNSDLKYFKQLDLYAGTDKKLSGTAVFNASTNTMIFIYRDNGVVKTETYPYKMLTDGIELLKPFKVGNDDLSKLVVGDLANNVLPISAVTSGNEHLSGSFTPADTSLYIYKNSGKVYTDGEVQYEIISFSPKLDSEYMRRIKLLNGYYLSQLYLNWTDRNGKKDQNLYVMVQSVNAGIYDYNDFTLKPTIKNEDQLYYEYVKGSANLAVNSFVDPFINDVLANPKGFTIVPLGYNSLNQPVFTLVSRADSRYYMTVLQTTRRDNVAKDE